MKLTVFNTCHQRRHLK